MSIIDLILAILVGALISGFNIWIVGKLGLGLEVSGFGAAFIAAIIIAVVTGLINWLLEHAGYPYRKRSPGRHRQPGCRRDRCCLSAAASCPA